MSNLYGRVVLWGYGRTMPNLYGRIALAEIDTAVCKVLEIPQDIYDMLPGMSGEKFFTKEGYNFIYNSKINYFELIKNLKEDSDFSRKTLIFDSPEILKSISYKSTSPAGYSTRSRLDIGGAMGHQINSEHFEFVNSGNDYRLSSFSGVRADIDLNSKEISDKVKSFIKTPDMNNHQNTFWNIANDDTHIVARDLIRAKSNVVNINDMEFDSNYGVDSLLVNARQLGISMLDSVAFSQGKRLNTADDNFREM